MSMLALDLCARAVSADDGLRVELGRDQLLTAEQARALAAQLIAAADRIG